MERTTFLEHYRVCLGYDGTPNELGRDGGAVAYEAVDERSSEPVVLTLVPVESIDPTVREQFEDQARAVQRLRHVNIAKVFDFGREGEDYVYVSERLPGETLAAWVAQHGPMPADATLRVAEQIVSVLSSASFHKLPYPPVEPAYIFVVPGQTPEGGWPLVKLTNFGLAGLTSDAESPATVESPLPGEATKLEPKEAALQQATSAAESASVESGQPKREHRTPDLDSQIYSLGGIMYFLLTGVALSAEAVRRPSKFSGFPKPLRNLLAQILHPNPDQRPKDLVVLGEMIRSCLLKIERRLALANRYGIPFRTTIPRIDSASAAAFAANSIGVWCARRGCSGACSDPVAGADWQNLTPGPRDKVDWRSGWGSRIFTSAGRGPKCCHANGACDCAIAGGKCGYGVRESTSDGHCGSSQFVSSCIPGSSTEPGIERTTAGRGNAGRFRGRFPGRGSGNLNCERACYGIPERLRGCTTAHYRSVEFAQQKETRGFDIVASPGFDARPNARNYVRRKDNLPFALGPHEDCRARLGPKSIRSAQASPRSNPAR